MNEIEIGAIVSEVAALLKKDANKRRDKIIEFNPIYRQTVELKDRIRTHTELNHVPKDMVRHRGPYEDDKQYKYRTENWNNITMPYFMKAIGKLNRIMNPSNYSITWGSNQTNEQEYVNKYIPVFGSVENYFRQIVMVEKIKDPNALLVVKPLSLPVREEIVDGNQVFVLDDSEMIDPVPVIFPCERVIKYKEGVYALVEVEEKSMVQWGNGEVREGLIFEFYDTENIWRIVQKGKKSDYKFSDPELYYPHNLGYLPCQKLKGIPKIVDRNVLYYSSFINAIPHLDVALYGYSNIDMSIVTQLFPQRVEYVDRCDYQGCDNGRITRYVDERPIIENCPNCMGTGHRATVGPMMVKQHIAPDPLNTSTDTQIPFPGLAYVAPPHEQLQFVAEKNDKDIYAAFSFLNFDLSNSEVKGSETALGKQIDREELFSFLMGISMEFFGLLSFTLDTLVKMRFGESAEGPVVSPPSNFAIRSEYDLTEELIEGKKAGLPDIALRQIIRDYVAKRFSNQVNIEKIVSLVFLVDRIITANRIDTSLMLSNGTAEHWEVVLHDSIYTIIDNALIEDTDFFNKELSYQKDYIVKEAKEISARIQASKNQPIIKVEDIAE